MTDDELYTPPPLVKKAISFLNPWPHTILHMGKRIENRKKPIVSRGNFDRTLWLHVSQDMPNWAEKEALDFVKKIGLDPAQIPKREALVYGGFVATFRIVDVIMPGGKTRSGGPHPLAGDKWYMGLYGYVLDEVAEIPFVPCKGALSCWVVPKEEALLLTRNEKRAEFVALAERMSPAPSGLLAGAPLKRSK